MGETDGATVTLSNAEINGGIVCKGTATIILEGNNYVKSNSMAGIQVGGAGSMLTIKGSGSLTAIGGTGSAGIGLSQASDEDAIGGGIVIEGGIVTALGGEYGGEYGAGIGCGASIFADRCEIVVEIYDAVNMVDASSISESIIYIHDDGLVVTDYKNDYFTIIEDGESKTIYQKMSVADIESQVYTGEAITPKPTVTIGSLDITENVDYEYSYSNNVNAGIVTVTVTFLGKYDRILPVSKTFEITRATPTVEPPTSADPKLAGACVALVTAGSTNSGDMLYSVLREDGSLPAYSTDIPCADRAGRYTVYYKVEESDNWFGVEARSVDVTVENEIFKVAFVNAEGDEIISREYEFGTPAEEVELPTENPAKADDEMYAYTFAGWSPQIQYVTGAMTYSPIYDKTRIGFGSATIAADGSWATIDGKSSKKIDADLDAVEITGDVTLNREFVAEKPSTIVLPFNTHIDNVPGFTFYSFKGVVKENGVWKKVVFDEVDKEGDGLIYANTPYIVVAKEDVGGLIVENGVVFDLNSVRPMSSEDGIWQFVGTYDFKVWNEGDRYIGRSYGFAAEERDGARIGQFVMLGSNAYAYPMRAYLYYAGGNSGESRSMAPALFKAAPAVASIDELPESMDVVIRGEEGTTVIGSINIRTGEFRSADNRWFDLNGRFLGNKKPTVKGIYYNNGKKVIVK